MTRLLRFSLQTPEISHLIVFLSLLVKVKQADLWFQSPLRNTTTRIFLYLAGGANQIHISSTVAVDPHACPQRSLRLGAAALRQQTNSSSAFSLRRHTETRLRSVEICMVLLVGLKDLFLLQLQEITKRIGSQYFHEKHTRLRRFFLIWLECCSCLF